MVLDGVKRDIRGHPLGSWAWHQMMKKREGTDASTSKALIAIFSERPIHVFLRSLKNK